MIILHAAVVDREFVLWAEISDSDVSESGLTERSVSTQRSNGKAVKSASTPAFLAFGASASLLATKLIATFSTGKGALATTACEATVWLPTTKGRPLASSPLIAPAREYGTIAPMLAPWRIEALRLPISRALPLLCSIVDKEMPATGVLIGRDLLFWAQAMRLAGAMVANQQFLPGLTAENGDFRAVWEPVFSGANAQSLARLARAMPHVCRAVTLETQSSAAMPVTAQQALAEFLGAIVDHLVRDTSQHKTNSRTKPVFDSAHEAWLHALTSPDGRVSANEAEISQLALHHEEWRRPIRVLETMPWRLCFRLEEPLAEDDALEEGAEGTATPGEWQLAYLLQSRDDPSLLVPVAQAWAPKGAGAAALRQKGLNEGLNVREYLLTALGQAAVLCPPVEASLKTAAPSGYTLDVGGAHEFLNSQAGLLEQAGFGVFLPAWWTRKGTKLHLSAQAKVKSPKMQGGSGLSLEEIVKFEWEVALGGEKLTLRELETLARLKAPLVRFRGQWVQLSAEEIQAALAFWKTRAAPQNSPQASVREIVRMALGASTAGPLPLEGVAASGWVGDLLKQLQGGAKFEELSPPAGFCGQLRPYQLRGYSWLSFLRRWGLGACLADDMGLGKTPTTLAFLQSQREAGERRPSLLVCPTSVIANWQKEAARFTPELPVLVHHGLGRSKGAGFQKQAAKHAIVLSSYALLHRDYEALKKVEWAGVILDEAQNIKNPETKQSKAARSLPCDWRVALTGTPVENNVGDLWSLMEFLNAGFLGGQSEFKRRFFVPIQTGSDPEAAPRLQRLTTPFILRRLKTDKTIIADLPEKMEMKVFCALTKEQASLYAAVVAEASRDLDEAEGISRKGLVLATLMKLKQVCNHPAQFLGDNSSITARSGKLARLTEMLEEMLSIGERALIFTQFREMGDIIRRHTQETFGREVLFLHGGVPKKARDRMVERFGQENDAPPIFILSLKAGGVGLNLTRANHVFHFDRWWNPAVENQATDRAFRIGQTKNVQVHKFLCAGTLEEKIDEMIERKKAVAEKVVGAGEGWLTELTTDELKDLFALRAEAVNE